MPRVCVFDGTQVDELRPVRAFGSTGLRKSTAGFLPISEQGLQERKRRQRRFDIALGFTFLAAVVIFQAWTALLYGLGAALIVGPSDAMRGLRVNSRQQVTIYRPHPGFVVAWNASRERGPRI